jgi:hypothetical protein
LARAKGNAGKRGPHLKVFVARIGFHDVVVAATSQKAALEAWGVHANLFAQGAAKITQDPDLVEAALANPGTPLRRGFPIDTSHPDAPRKAEPKRAARIEKAPKKPRKIADKSKLLDAEKALKEFERDAAKQIAELEEEIAHLRSREAQLKTGFEARRRRLTKLRDEAEADYKKQLREEQD